MNKSQVHGVCFPVKKSYLGISEVDVHCISTWCSMSAQVNAKKMCVHTYGILENELEDFNILAIYKKGKSDFQLPLKYVIGIFESFNNEFV